MLSGNRGLTSVIKPIVERKEAGYFVILIVGGQKTLTVDSSPDKSLYGTKVCMACTRCSTVVGLSMACASEKLVCEVLRYVFRCSALRWH